MAFSINSTLGCSLSFENTYICLVLAPAPLSAWYCTLRIPPSPGAYSFFSSSGTVQPQVLVTSLIMSLPLPLFSKLNSQVLFDPGAIFPKSWVVCSKNIVGGGPLGSGVAGGWAGTCWPAAAGSVAGVEEGVSSAIVCAANQPCKNNTQPMMPTVKINRPDFIFVSPCQKP